MEKRNQEEGFILMTAVVLLAVLMILGTVSLIKSNIEIKMSAGSVEAEQAFAAMNAGLNETYAYWKYDGSDTSGGIKEFNDLASFISTGSGTEPSIYVNKYPDRLIGSDPYGFATSLTDVYTEAKTTGIRVYTLLANGGVSTSNAWDSVTEPQVAVWATSFENQSGAANYPYVSPSHTSSGSGCSDCTVVVYALGKSGNALRLGREYMSTSISTIKGYGAMINAPKYKDKGDWCAGTGDRSTTAHSTTNASSGGTRDTHLIDSTQAPGGIAIASNNSIKWPSTSKPWDEAIGSHSAAANIVPFVIYDPGKVAVGDYPNVAGDHINSIVSTVSKTKLFDGTQGSYMDYFDSANSQLFQLDAYREAANRISGFLTEDVYGQAVNTGGTMLGNAATLASGNSNHGRTGTLQWSDVKYNIHESVPMYGLVRLLIPAQDADSTMSDCSSVDEFELKFGYYGQDDSLNSGKLIVYGAALFDFFNDSYSAAIPGPGHDGIYQPGEERLLTPQEALTFKVNVDIPLMFNPAMDGLVVRTGAGSMDDYSGTSILDINTYPNGSPSWDKTSDKLTSGDGAMDLIWDVWYVATHWDTKVHTGSGYATGFAADGYKDWMWKKRDGTSTWDTATGGDEDKMYDLLDYYIRTTAEASKPVWSHRTAGDIETNYQFFKISSKSDLKDSNSAADLYHSFLPSGYTHGWKRAFAETGLGGEPSGGTSDDDKTIWSEDLLPSGSPFHADRKKYLFVTRDDSTGKVYIDKDFADLPAEMYAGGLVDMHQEVNTSGVTYSPGQLELEQKDDPNDAMQYLNGIVITGHGTYMKSEASNAKTVIVYDDTSIDNLPTKKETFDPARKYWQELK